MRRLCLRDEQANRAEVTKDVELTFGRDDDKPSEHETEPDKVELYEINVKSVFKMCFKAMLTEKTVSIEKTLLDGS